MVIEDGLTIRHNDIVFTYEATLNLLLPKLISGRPDISDIHLPEEGAV
jgi:hypothetical protein